MVSIFCFGYLMALKVSTCTTSYWRPRLKLINEFRTHTGLYNPWYTYYTPPAPQHWIYWISGTHFDSAIGVSDKLSKCQCKSVLLSSHHYSILLSQK